MRRFLMLLALMVPFVMPAVGCQKSRPDPREQEGFVDDTDPDMTVKNMGDPDKQGKMPEKEGSTAPDAKK